jgi:hypothetical protein
MHKKNVFVQKKKNVSPRKIIKLCAVNVSKSLIIGFLETKTSGIIYVQLMYLNHPLLDF